MLFSWWSQRVLRSGRIAWRALLPAAVATAAGLYGLRVFSRLDFSPLIASSAVTYGPVGTVLVIQSWLAGAGVVVLGGALVGRLLDEELPHVAIGRSTRIPMAGVRVMPGRRVALREDRVAAALTSQNMDNAAI